MKNAIVVDKDGNKVEFVVLDSNNKPICYRLKYKEKIITENIAYATTLVKPKWNFTTKKWEDVATDEEKEAWQNSMNEPSLSLKTDEELQRRIIETQKQICDLEIKLLIPKLA